ncbi:DUF3488 and transglutaminase-like domain-containing protein [Glutamicibacter sp. MNS18]|uniref:DUF3488 and transglutaminase-like domain-containing protein n=1 Tax=Glutamicibacter sp. MNS18 TaxID=2989817 RepID=UPI002235CFFA|nr:DUF3488 and transglutaminase-like domain-containing protein [Glutamicibacter sp. MNS18]MCW4465111.1 DUF3488 and transglutaminase-like domain-containing protein [Glutamicibacter sp. MNS18]
MSTLLTSPPPAPTADQDTDPPQEARAHPLALLATGASLLTAMLAGMASLNGVVEGFGWLFSVWFPLLLIHASAALVRGSRLPSWLAPVASTLVALAVLWFHPAVQDPTLGAGRLQRFGQVLEDASLEFATQVPEVAFTRAVDFAFLLMALVLALLVETLASFRRLAGLVVLPLSFTPVLASLFKLSGAGTGYLVVLLVALVCYFTFLPYAWPSRRLAPLPSTRQLQVASVLALLTSVVLVAASTWMPGFRQGMLPEGSRPSGQLFASNLDPLLNLGRDLRSNNSATAFTYFTSAERAPYLRTHVITNLDSERWEPDTDLQQRSFSGTTALRDEFMSFGATSQYTELLWEDPPRDRQLPLPAHSYLIEGIAGSWQWQPQTSIAQFTTASREATRQVRISHSEPQLDANLARNFAYFQQLSPPVDRSLSRLPQDNDGVLGQVLTENLQLAYGQDGAPEGDFDRAVAIQDYLRSSRFSYSEQTPLREGYDGANLKVITAFLDRRAGYCVHFATTMAVMARAEGIPSRVVIGYAPGEAIEETRTRQGGAGTPNRSSADPMDTELAGYRVSGQQAHAWPELYLPGLGWTPFEPTPGRGVAPDYAPAQDSETVTDPDPGDVPLPPEELVPSAPAPSADPDPAPPGATEDTGPAIPWLAVWILLPLTVLLGVLPAWRRGRERRRRLLALKPGGEQAAQALWEELQHLGTAYGYPLHPGQSESDYCAMLATGIPQCRDQLARLERIVEESFYALRHPDRNQGVSIGQDLALVHDALRRQATLPQRIRAVLWPASVEPFRRHAQRRGH